MKRTKTASKNNDRTAKSSQPSMTCSCQILNDTSLSNIGDSECDCSDCLEAHLQAFNELKQQQVKTNTTSHVNQRGKGQEEKNKHSLDKAKIKNGSHIQINRYKSSDRFQNQKSRTKKKFGFNGSEISDNNQEVMQEQFDRFSNGQINDFLLITQHRTRKYLQDMKKIKADQKLQKDILKQKIKKNLQMLKYTAQQLRNNNENNSAQHPYKWNHSKYKCECNGKAQKHRCCSKIKVKSRLDTNLEKFKQNFDINRDQILDEKKRMRQQLRRLEQQKKCPHDLCPDHHNKTDKNKIKQIQKFIMKNVKKYHKQKKKAKREEQQNKNVRNGKLRAIQIKSKQILAKSKKIDNNVTKTSFKLSIDNYDTFSQLRQQNQRRKKMKQDKIKIQKAIKKAGGQLQNKIYQYQDQDEQDISQNIIKQQIKLQNAPQLGYENRILQTLQKIVYDAHLKVPNQLNKKLTQVKKPESHKHSPRETKKQKQETKAKNLSKGKQQKEKKRLQQQIQRKKKEIVNEYQKRNRPQNHDIRKQYQEKVKKNNKGKQNKQVIKPSRDVIIQELGDINKVKTMQKGMKGPRGQDMDIFHTNYNYLASKKKL